MALTTAASLGAQLPLLAAAPFVGLLAAVSALETAGRNWWNRLRNKALVAVAAAILASVPLIASHPTAGATALAHSLTDYVSFIVLLGTLFVIAGGIEIRGSLSGTPLANMTMLAIGALLANLIGTTGAAMLLIRPYLRANAHRRRRAHLVVFFILIVANSGGLLTPLGDPPLYLGFLKGVPFAWTLQLWLPWLFVNGVALVIFNVVDQFILNREERSQPDHGLLDELLRHEPPRVVGGRNILLLLAVISVIVARGAGIGTAGTPWPFGPQEAALALLALLSYQTTPRSLHHSNHFSLRPMAAVAIVFFGIFTAMTAPLLLLNAHAADMGITAAWQYFWVSGGLSSTLDTAPTYLAMTAVAAGQAGVSAEDPRYLSDLLTTAAGPAQVAAVSCGTVFMGCLTYLGNGPNLMVKEIAEHRGVPMPHFFAYAAIATVTMVPVFAATTLIFFAPS